MYIKLNTEISYYNNCHIFRGRFNSLKKCMKTNCKISSTMYDIRNKRIINLLCNLK